MDNLMSMESGLTEEGHASYMEENYKEMIYFLEQKLLREPKCVESIREWILCYQALADIYQQKGDLDLAQKCLFIPHRSMLYMAHSYSHDEELEMIAVNAISLTLPPIMKLAEVYPPCDNCMQELRAQQAVLQTNVKTYH